MLWVLRRSAPVFETGAFNRSATSPTYNRRLYVVIGVVGAGRHLDLGRHGREGSGLGLTCRRLRYFGGFTLLP